MTECHLKMNLRMAVFFDWCSVDGHHVVEQNETPKISAFSLLHGKINIT